MGIFDDEVDTDVFDSRFSRLPNRDSRGKILWGGQAGGLSFRGLIVAKHWGAFGCSTSYNRQFVEMLMHGLSLAAQC